jgi:hypothetical protein
MAHIKADTHTPKYGLKTASFISGLIFTLACSPVTQALYRGKKALHLMANTRGADES